VLEVVGNAIVGGMETVVARLIERLPRERFEVTALLPYESRYAEQLRALGIEVLIAPMPDDLPWSSIRSACALVKAGGIDLLHAHMPNAHQLAALAGRLAGKPVLTTIHARELSSLDVELHRLAGTHVSVVCKHSYFHALALGVNAAQLSCIANGVDGEVFKPRTRREDGGPLRGMLGIPATAPLVAFVGRLSVEKGPDLFLRAALLLKQRVPEAHCVLVGDGPMREQLAEFVARFELASTTHFAGLRHDMPAVYGDIDVVISTSHTEAMPLALMEAMASGVPVVATRVGGVPELLQHGETGWLVGPRDFKAAAARTTELLRTPGELARMGRHAREQALERMDLASSVERTAQLLTRLAKARDERPIGAVQNDPPSSAGKSVSA
jgi:glycosyltransferase involved in cell wall biosynthesis